MVEIIFLILCISSHELRFLKIIHKDTLTLYSYETEL